MEESNVDPDQPAASSFNYDLVLAGSFPQRRKLEKAKVDLAQEKKNNVMRDDEPG